MYCLLSTLNLLPIPLETYGTANSENLAQILAHRIRCAPFNAFATTIFLCAVLHTFFAPIFQKIATRFNSNGTRDRMLHILFHFLGEIEVIFGLWILPLAIGILYFYDYRTLAGYIQSVNYVEPMFIAVIMTIAASRPILQFAQRCMQRVASLRGCTPKAWWFAILTIGPLLGSFITEPAAITISALLLSQQFYALEPSMKFRYATLGLLFVNVSVGGVLTHFAAPPVLMVAERWGWNTPYMFTHFGVIAMLGIAIATALYGFLFRRELHILQEKSRKVEEKSQEQPTVPLWIIGIHLCFLIWTIVNIHTPALFILGFLFFLGFVQITAPYQTPISLRSPVLVGFFLAGLVTHGGLQQWWIEPVLGQLGESSLFWGATLLTAFNDNAAITYLSSLVPSIAQNAALKHAVVCGAVTGGGLTVIANAPNPAGQAILSKHFSKKISPLGLLMGAIPPTLILATCFLCL